MGEARYAVRAGRALVAVACVIAATAAWAVVPRPAGATEDVTAQRLGGGNRYATAGGIAVTAYPGGAATVVLASGESFPDALAGAALAGSLDGPLVLTARDRLSPEAGEAIDQLGAETVVILGGEAAVSAAVEDDLAGLAVTRVSGDDRYATAAAAARRIGAEGIGLVGGLRTAVVASGLSFADALAGGGIANAGDGSSGVHPVLLVGDTVPAATAAVIEELGIEQVVILGGTAAVAADVEADLEQRTGNPAIRLAGGDRFATGAAVARAMVTDFGAAASTVLLASGETFADALAGGVLSGRASAPILLTPRAALTSDAESFLVDHASTVAQVVALGGTTAVSQTALDEAERAAETVPEEEAAEEEAIAVAPATSTSQNNQTSRSYTASGLAGIDDVDIVLVACANVTAATGGHRFRNANTNDVADGTGETGASPDRASTNASISSVNGTSVSLTNNDFADDVAPRADGTVAFVVSGPSTAGGAGGCVRPVVFDDADGDSTLDTTTVNPATATEELGVGGAVTFNPQSASSGGSSGSSGTTQTPQGTSFGTRDVSENDEGDRTFDACEYVEDTDVVNRVTGCDQFRYDADDRFVVGNQTLTLVEFETRLSTGDDVTIRYCTTRCTQSVFTLIDEAPATPTILDVSESEDGVTVTFREVAAADSYRLYRAQRDTGCPTKLGDYGVFVDSVEPQVPNGPNQVVDADIDPGTRYCYVVVAEHEGDESEPSAPANITTEGDAPPSDDPELPTLDDLRAAVEEATATTTTTAA